MKKEPTSEEYLAQLGEVITEILPQGFVREESRTPSFVRRMPGRTEHIGIRLLTHHWPYGVLDLTFGVSYDDFREVFNKFTNQSGLQIPHIYHDTMNIHQMRGLRYFPRILFTKIPLSWRFIQLGGWPCESDESPRIVMLRTKSAIKGVLMPFFNRFSDIQEAWNSLRDNDGWSLQGWDYSTVLAFGLFVGDADGVAIAKARLTQQFNDDGVAKVDRYMKDIRAFLGKDEDAQQAVTHNPLPRHSSLAEDARTSSLGYKRRAMKKTIILGLIALSLISRSHPQEPVTDANWKKIAALRVPIKEVRVVSGNEIEIAGIRCRLLGIEIPDRVKGAAKRFLELYMKDYGEFFSIYNDNAPLNDKDGTPLIWLNGHGNGGWAQETLVQAGLATISISGFEDYKFTTSRKDGVGDFDWKTCLKDAEAAHKAGRAPKVNFKWQQQE